MSHVGNDERQKTLGGNQLYSRMYKFYVGAFLESKAPTPADMQIKERSNC